MINFNLNKRLSKTSFNFKCRLQGKQFQWPMSSSDRPTDSSSSSTQENEDSGRDSVDSRTKVVSPPTRIPKVKFTCDGDDHLNSSPENSVSSVE